jgi:translocation and assembly module TamB
MESSSFGEEGNQPDPQPPRRSKWKRRLLVWGGGTVLVAFGGGLIYGWFFLQRQLVPLVETELTDFLNRPVEIGSVEGFSLSHLRFGASKIAATSSDPTNISLEAVEVNYNLFRLIFKRELSLEVTAIAPDIYLAQGKKRNWLATPFDSGENKQPSDGGLKVNLRTLRLQDADVILAARSQAGKLQTPVKAAISNGSLDLIDNGKSIEFDLAGKLVKGGDIEVSGTAIPQQEAINLVIRGDGIAGADIDNLLTLPFDVPTGKVGANLDVKIRSDRLPNLVGVAKLNNVTVAIPGLPTSFNKGNGHLRFQGTAIRFDEVATRYGFVPGLVNGIIDLEKGYQLNAITRSVKIQEVLNTLKLKKPPIALLGDVKGDVRVTGALERPRLDIDVVTTKRTRVDRVDFRPGSRASVQFANATLAITDFRATPIAGGRLTGTGKMQFKTGTQQSPYQFNLQAANVPAPAIARLYKTNLPVDIERVSGQAKFIGTLENPNKLIATGSAVFPLGGGTVVARNFRVANGRWQGDLQALGVSIASLNVNVTPPVRRGKLNATLQVSGSNADLRLDAIRAAGIANAAIAGGLISTNNLTLNNGRWDGTFQARGLQSDRLFTNSQQLAGRIDGTFALTGAIANTLETISGTGKGSFTLPGGIITAETIRLSQGQFKALLTTERVAVSQFYQAGRGTVAANLNVTGTLSNPTLNAIDAEGKLNFSDGIGAIAQPVAANVNWNGRRLNLQQVTAPGIAASGWIDIASELLGTPAAIEQFEIKVAANRADVRNFSLALPVSAERLDYSGKINFNGIIAGTPQALRIDGDAALENFKIVGLTFDRILKGTVKGIPQQGIALDLTGVEDRIQLALSPNYQPVSFNLALDRMEVSGARKNDLLQIKANNVDIGIFQKIAQASKIPVSEAFLAQPFSGALAGNFVFNFKTLELLGEEIAIANPRLGRVQGDRFTGSFRYFNGNFALKNALFQKNESRYLLEGELANTKQGAQWQAKINVSQGEIQDVLETLQIFELADFGRGLNPNYVKAAALYQSKNPTPTRQQPPLFSVGTPEATVQEQLRRFSEIETLLRRQRKQRQEASPFPELAALTGKFDGELVASATPERGVNAAFDFQGRAWQWETFVFNRLKLKGDLRDGIVDLKPLEIQSGKSLLAFSGRIGGRTQAGELQLTRIPLDLVSTLLNIPSTFALGGFLNGSVKLGGSRDDPQARGEVAIAQATINQTPLSTTQGNFNFDRGRLDFKASSKLTPQAEPLTLTGTLPYQVPFATVKSESDRLQLSLRVKNQGMKLLNLLSRDAISWVDGKGAIALDISGRFDRQQGRPQALRADGIATFKEAAIAAQVIPDAPITQVNGKILFDFDRVEVKNLQGKFSGGRVTVAGKLPLVQSRPQNDPLTVALDNLVFNLKGLYRGGVSGKVTVGGSALEPGIGGKLNLFDGQVLLGETNAQSGGGAVAANSDVETNSTEFNNLELTLGDNIQLVRPPILNFLATGSLTLNGTTSQPRPKGTITLKSGQVNLFASQLRLDRGEDNSAQFSPVRGLDPYLNIQLISSATETVRDALRTESSSSSSSEIIEPFSANLDSLQTIRIRANIQGYASQLANNIELTSTPPRSQQEIVTLLGGGFVNTLGRGDTTLGLANLAGSAVFGSLQNVITDRLGVSEFRIFSAPLIDEEERLSRNQFGIAAEAAIDLTNDLSFSTQKILNSDRPFQFGLQYRVNNNIVIRGSSNFSDDSRAVIEFEQRF